MFGLEVFNAFWRVARFFLLEALLWPSIVRVTLIDSWPPHSTLVQVHGGATALPKGMPARGRASRAFTTTNTLGRLYAFFNVLAASLLPFLFMIVPHAWPRSCRQALCLGRRWLGAFPFNVPPKKLSILCSLALQSLSTFSIGVMREQMLAVDIGLIDADRWLLVCERWEGWRR